MNCSSYILKFVLYPSVFTPYEFIFHEIHKLDEKTKWNFSCCQKTVWFSVLAPMGKCYFSPKSRLTSVFQFWNKGFKMYFYHAKVWRGKKKSPGKPKPFCGNLTGTLWSPFLEITCPVLIWERERHANQLSISTVRFISNLYYLFVF